MSKMLLMSQKKQKRMYEFFQRRSESPTWTSDSSDNDDWLPDLDEKPDNKLAARAPQQRKINQNRLRSYLRPTTPPAMTPPVKKRKVLYDPDEDLRGKRSPLTSRDINRFNKVNSGSSGFSRTDYSLYKKLKTESFPSPDQKMKQPKSKLSEKPCSCGKCRPRYDERRELGSYYKKTQEQNESGISKKTDYSLYKKLKTESFPSSEQKMIPSNRYKCEDCDRYMLDFAHYKNHRWLRHDVIVESAGARSTPITTLKSDQYKSGVSVEYKCEDCDRYLLDVNHYKNHRRLRHGVTIENQSAKNTPNTTSKSNKKWYRCSSCNLTYDSRDDYKDHMRRAHRQPFVDKTSKENAVHQHEREKDVLKSSEKAEPTECPVCSQKLYKEHRKEHLKKFHPELLKCRCDSCCLKARQEWLASLKNDNQPRKYGPFATNNGRKTSTIRDSLYNRTKLERAHPEISGETVAEYERLVKDDIKHLNGKSHQSSFFAPYLPAANRLAKNRNRTIPSPITSEDDEVDTTISSDEFATTIPNEVTTNIFEDFRSGKQAKFRCANCSFAHSSSVEMEIHSHEHIGEQHCPDCLTTLKTRPAVKVHIKARHLIELDDFYRNTGRQDAAVQDKMAELGSQLVKEFLDKVSI